MPTPLSRDPRRAARERSTTSTESDPRAPSSTKGLEPTTPPDSTTASKTKVRQRPPRRPQTHFPPPRASAPAIPRLNQRGSGAARRCTTGRARCRLLGSASRVLNRHRVADVRTCTGPERDNARPRKRGRALSVRLRSVLVGTEVEVVERHGLTCG